ncbi:uncharacterized protein LOC113557824 [Rhopalosiphum maidis]|uniref:uncharacterized protein LOC113557824 n=1 Tax=Rhopalosiphum maidis TaxID=43146 RepID=UPI000EFE7F94|nr:uncharacterized protein LOC113557824 [Rhopalosiphum maidis]
MENLKDELDLNAASWSLTGSWKTNSIVYISKNACSSFKMICGYAWYSIMKAFNSPKTNRPIPPGAYITLGIDLKEFENHHNFPKVYFYGKYKFTYKMKNLKNDVLGCAELELSPIRPWE